MGTTTQVAQSVRRASPIAKWHLLSLDAPTVAAVWTWAIARASHVHLPAAIPLAMGLAVWILYAADRLLDAQAVEASADGYAGELEARHFFHHRHRRIFLTGIVLAGAALAALLPMLDREAIRLYLVEGVLLVGWLLMVHATRSAHRLPKEIAVGIFFAAAVFIPTVAREPALRMELLPEAILFAGLCGLNCLFIYRWEHETPLSETRAPHATTRFGVGHLRALAVAIMLTGTALAIAHIATGLSAACGLAALLLLVLHRNRRRFTRSDLRAAADLALLTPLLLLPLVR